MNKFTALADPNRIRIIEILALNGETSVTDIKKEFDITAPAVSQHLKVLKEAEIVSVRKLAQQRLYSLNTNKITEITDWLTKIKIDWEKRLDRLDDYLLKNFKKENNTDE